MADLDPKELALKNIPLIVIYVAALVPIGLYFTMVADGVKAGRRGSFAASERKLAGRG